ncbi:MAG: dihydrodipicolinate synthase family protein [Polyangiaceae bacterium]|nr:dihydrodipicolinate synthase family protein [Polyangiaceae bacterium]
MTAPFRPYGTHTALVTPFDAHGVLDVGGFKRLVEFQRAAGVTGLVPCGTTGESPTLTWEEHDALVRTAVALVDGKLSVLAGTGSNNTAEAIRGTRDARDDGASAALLVDCYYNGPSSLELRTEYYERIIAAVPDLPLVPYVVPGRSGCALAAADLAHLHLEHPTRVPAVKEATGDLARMRQDREFAGDTLAILSGDDDLTLPMMTDPAIRAAGAISVMSNVAPGAVSALVTAAAAGDADRANRLAEELAPLLGLVGCKVFSSCRLPNGREAQVEDRFRNPLPVKTVMAGLGMLEGTCRPPLGRMTAAAVAKAREAVRAVWSRAPQHLTPIEEAFGVSIEARLADDAVWERLVARR